MNKFIIGYLRLLAFNNSENPTSSRCPKGRADRMSSEIKVSNIIRE